MNVKRASRRRRGSIYVITLATGLIVSLLGLAALLSVRIERRGVNDHAAAREAELLAARAVDMALFRIENDPDWRQKMKDGVWEVDQSGGARTYSFQGIDPDDGDLTDLDDDPVLIIATGKCGPARQKVQVRLVAEVTGLSCLGAAVHAGGNITVNSSTISVTGGPLSTNSDLANAGTIDGDVEADSVSGPGTISGTTTAPAPAKEMPDSNVFDFYTDPANGTYIDISSLPLSGGSRYMETQVLSPATNPFGSMETNPQGVYVIDCVGQKISIQNCRIVGTLVLLNPSLCEVYTVNWEPAVANYPALMVQGNADFYCNSNWALEEGPPLSFNFNPPGTPYLGDADGNTDDTYPVVIKGLVYVSGAVNTWQSPAFDGVVVVGATLSTNGDHALTYQQTFFDDPPPGFATPPVMKIAPGSWEKVVD